MLPKHLQPFDKAVLEDARNFWSNFLYSFKENEIDRERVKWIMNYLSNLNGCASPEIIFASSPAESRSIIKEIAAEAQCHAGLPKYYELSNYLSSYGYIQYKKADKEIAKFNSGFLWKIRDFIDDHLYFRQPPKSFRDYVPLDAHDGQVYFRQQEPNIREYGILAAYSFVAYYDFFTRIDVISNDWCKPFRDLLLAGIYEMVMFQKYCIVSPLPVQIHKNSDWKWHNLNGPAASWKDGYGVYFWNGQKFPGKWLTKPELVTKKTILGVKNLEKRRMLRDVIGTERYLNLLDVQVIDEDIDNNLLPMKLYRTKEKDVLLKTFLYFLNVICPSTGREYYICVRPARSVWKAKAGTFRDNQIMVRHGDVGLINLDKFCKRPLYES